MILERHTIHHILGSSSNPPISGHPNDVHKLTKHGQTRSIPLSPYPSNRKAECIGLHHYQSYQYLHIGSSTVSTYVS